MARVMVSLGILAALAVEMACLNRGLASGSLPPFLAEIINSLMTFVNTFPRLASWAAFLCLMLAHLLCPAINSPMIIKSEIQNYDDKFLIPNEGIERNGI